MKQSAQMILAILVFALLLLVAACDGKASSPSPSLSTGAATLTPSPPPTTSPTPTTTPSSTPIVEVRFDGVVQRLSDYPDCSGCPTMRHFFLAGSSLLFKIDLTQKPDAGFMYIGDNVSIWAHNQGGNFRLVDILDDHTLQSLKTPK